MPTGFTLPSFAKINWMLRILGKREDGFHELVTVFQTISLFDLISFRASSDLSMTCDIRYIPTDRRNLIMKAAAALREQFDITTGAAIHLNKRIPSPGGLGGGSSNAAVTLIGLARLWDIDINNSDISRLAAALGSDVPFFLRGGTAIGTGSGVAVEAIQDREASFMLVVTPQVRVSTKKAFERLNAPTLTTDDTDRILRVCRSQAESLDLLGTALINDFEASVFAAYPEIRRV